MTRGGHGGEPHDPVWGEYVEAVRHLARMPELLDERRRQASADERAAAQHARAALDAALGRCEQWRAQARRAIATAEARLVAAHVLVPDPSSAPSVDYESPDPLVDEVDRLVRELDSAVVELQNTRRRMRLEAAEEAARRLRAAARRRRWIRSGVLASVVLAVLALAVVGLLRG